MIFYTSDLHFDHKNILYMCNRPFENVEEMNESIVEKWNAKVKATDVVYILGDVTLNRKNLSPYVSKLNGKKILILGNHDSAAFKPTCTYYGSNIALFEKVTLMDIQKADDKTFTFCHYPLIEWPSSRHPDEVKSYLLYGHIHNHIDPKYRMLYESEYALNVGLDINNYEPVTFEELVENNRLFDRIALDKLNSQDYPDAPIDI